MVKIRLMKCPECGEHQYSSVDKRYTEKNNICWECDKDRYWEGKIELEEMQRRQKESLNLGI